MFLIGLTGGIAAGKSTVARRLVELGAVEIDADVLAREAVQPGSDGLRAVVEAFGPSVLTSSGELDRAQLGALVFADEGKRKQLESIVHPIVKELAHNAIARHSDDAVVVYTVPLLVEAGVDLPFDLVVTVEAPESAQIERMVRTRNMAISDATARIRSQATPAQRANRADLILNSNQSLGRLIDDVDDLWRTVLARAEAKGHN